jgi:hypothetical protein
MIHSRIRVCPTHHLRPRCPGCEVTRVPDGVFPMLEVPKGTVEWLREAAKWFATEGDDGALAFVEWIAVDMREAPKKAQ